MFLFGSLMLAPETDWPIRSSPLDRSIPYSRISICLLSDCTISLALPGSEFTCFFRFQSVEHISSLLRSSRFFISGSGKLFSATNGGSRSPACGRCGQSPTVSHRQVGLSKADPTCQGACECQNSQRGATLSSP
jgi:hypothetical protein